MRADARRNREAIMAAAVTLFTERGPSASMDEIAQAAGLGVGTLYRHFPDRQSLLEEIAADSLRRLVAAAESFADGQESGWQRLLLLVRECAWLPLALTKSVAVSATDHPELPRLVSTFNAMFEDVAVRAQREGSMRSDLDPSAVVDLLSVALCRAGVRADDALTTVVLDGLRAPATAGTGTR